MSRRNSGWIIVVYSDPPPCHFDPVPLSRAAPALRSVPALDHAQSDQSDGLCQDCGEWCQNRCTECGEHVCEECGEGWAGGELWCSHCVGRSTRNVGES